MITTTQKPELWTGLHQQLPADRRELVDELFARPTVEIIEGAAVITSIGLLGPRQSLQLTVMINAAASVARAIVLRISSRAQQTRGVLLPLTALESASEKIPTSASVLSAGGFGAVLAIGNGARTLVAEDERVAFGYFAAAGVYGSGDTDPPAEDVSTVLDVLCRRRQLGLENEPFGRTVRRLVAGRMMTFDRADAVLHHLLDTGDSNG